MEIDLTKLITSDKEKISINIDVNFDEESLSKTTIKKLIDTKFIGEISKLYDDEFNINGKLTGKMILPDDITLEDTTYNFDIDIDENFDITNEIDDNNLKIIKNTLDISNFLWQNILTEIPSKVVNEKNRNLTLEGNGWRLITEEDLKKDNNNPFSELKDKFN